MVTRFSFSLLLFLTLAKAGNNDDLSGQAVNQKQAQIPQPPLAACKDVSVIRKSYGEEFYQKLKNFNDNDVAKYEQDSIYIFAEHGGDVKFKKLVKIMTYKTDSDLQSIKREIDNLSLLNDVGATPKFVECASEFIKGKRSDFFIFYIIHEETSKNLLSKEMRDLFKSFSLQKQILKILQIASSLQKIHKEGISHQDFKPVNVVATDDQMTDVRLIDLDFSVKVGEKGIGGTKDYSSPDKFTGEFVATYHQDAFAFAVSILMLFDAEKLFMTEIASKCREYEESFTQDCRSVYVDKSFKFSEDRNIKDFTDYLQDHFFSEEKPLNLGNMIAKLVETFDKLTQIELDEIKALTEEVHVIREASKANVEIIRKLEPSLSKQEHMIL